MSISKFSLVQAVTWNPNRKTSETVSKKRRVLKQAHSRCGLIISVISCYTALMSASIFDTIDSAMLTRIQSLRLMDDDFMTVVFGGITS